MVARGYKVLLMVYDAVLGHVEKNKITPHHFRASKKIILNNQPVAADQFKENRSITQTFESGSFVSYA